MGISAFTSATLGSRTFGEDTLAEPSTVSIFVPTNQAPASPPQFMCEVGRGYFGQRVFSRPIEWTPPGNPSPSGKVTATISIRSVSGALVGKVRTDVQYSIVKSLQFTDDQKGSADLTLELNALPPFPLLPMSTIQVAIGNTSFGWYFGILDYTDLQGTKKDVYTYTAYGPRKLLAENNSNRIFNPVMDVGDVVDQLAQDIAAQFPINYNPSKIQTSTGTFIVTVNDLSKDNYEKVLDIYAAMAGNNGAYWGVDGDGDFYFQLKEDPDDITKAVRTFFVGYDVLSFDPKLNVDAIVNSIPVKRQFGRGSGGSGWQVVAVYNDDTSVKKYGVKAYPNGGVQFPGLIGDDDAQTIGEALLRQLSTPRISGDMKGKIVTQASDYLYRGNYRYVMPPAPYIKTLNDCDVVTDFTKVGSGDAALSLNEDILVSGVGSIQISYHNAHLDRADLNCEFKFGAIKTLYIWLYSERKCSITLGVGAGAWDNYTKSIAVDVTGQFFGVEWDLSATGISHINKFGLRIDDANGLTANKIYFDLLQLKVSGNQHFLVEKNESKYSFSGEGQTVDTTNGILPPKLYDFVSNALKYAQEATLTQENR